MGCNSEAGDSPRAAAVEFDVAESEAQAWTLGNDGESGFLRCGEDLFSCPCEPGCEQFGDCCDDYEA